jgi:preprotein translocase subunit SecE
MIILSAEIISTSFWSIAKMEISKVIWTAKKVQALAKRKH